MAEIIKVRCNGPNRHINEVDLRNALRQQTIARSVDFTAPDIPERVVLFCRDCTDGKVILTRTMIEEARQQHR